MPIEFIVLEESKKGTSLPKGIKMSHVLGCKKYEKRKVTTKTLHVHKSIIKMSQNVTKGAGSSKINKLLSKQPYCGFFDRPYYTVCPLYSSK